MLPSDAPGVISDYTFRAMLVSAAPSDAPTTKTTKMKLKLMAMQCSQRFHGAPSDVTGDDPCSIPLDVSTAWA